MKRWSPQCRLGINLGPSPHHARNVCLVLNPETGCVSPQYHCWVDDFFESVDSQDVSVSTNWQQLAGLSTSSLREPSSDPAPPSQPPSNQPPRQTPSNQADQPLLHPAANNLPQGPENPPQVKPKASNRFAGVSSRGSTRTMTQAMEDSIEN